MTGGQPGSECVIADLLHRASATVDAALAPKLRRRRMILSEWRVLASLQQFDGAAVGELAARTATDQTTLSRVIMRMEGRLLVQRRRRTADSRVIEVYLMPLGRKMFAEMAPAARALRDQAVAGLTEPELDMLGNMLRKILANLGYI